jgi:hypothetical protein
MDFATKAALATATVALYTALFHGSIFALRRSAHEHFWFAAMAFAVAGFALSGPAFYATRTASEGAFHQGLQIAFFAAVMVCFTKFSLAYLKLERPLLVYMAGIFAPLYAAFALFTPWFFTDRPIIHHVGRFSREFVESEISVYGSLAITCLTGFFLYVMALYCQNLSRPDLRVKPVLATLVVWLCVGLSDCAVVAKLYDAPYLLPFGYLGVVIVISGVLVGTRSGWWAAWSNRWTRRSIWPHTCTNSSRSARPSCDRRTCSSPKVRRWQRSGRSPRASRTKSTTPWPS